MALLKKVKIKRRNPTFERRNIMKKCLFMVILILTLFGCSGIKPSRSISKTPVPTEEPTIIPMKFTLTILPGYWNWCYYYDKFLPELKKMNEKPPRFVIDKDVIETYDWSTQTITLTKEGSLRLIEALPEDSELSEMARELKNLEKSLGWGISV